MSFRHHGFISIFLIASLISVTTAVSLICNSERGRWTATYCIVPGMGPTTTLIERTSAQNYSKVCLKGIDFGLIAHHSGYVAIWVGPECGGVFEVTHFGPPSWGRWGAWGACSASCDKGQQIRNRTCSSWVSSDCSSFNNYDKEQRSCNERSCESLREEESSICGLIPTRFRDRIIGGSDAPSFKFPWMVMLFNRRSNKNCGGSILDKNHILTAAHCVNDIENPKEFVPFKPSDFVVFSGSTLMPLYPYRGHIDGLKIRRVSKIMTHENYRPEMEKNDIAILTLKEPITFDNHHVPICLATTQASPSTDDCEVMGWGTKKNGKDAKVSYKLQYTKAIILDSSQCDFIYGNEKAFDENLHMCAGGSGHGPCHGDSGGPLICKASGENRYYQHGIAVRAAKNGCGFYPSIYVSVPSFLSWIQSKLTSIEA